MFPLSVEKLATYLLNEIDPTAPLLSSLIGEGYSDIKDGEIIICPDIEVTFPIVSALLRVRDSLAKSHLVNKKPTMETIIFHDLCEGLKEVVFASLAAAYKGEYLKDDYVGGGIREVNGKLVFVVRPATDEEKEKNRQAREKMRYAQHIHDALTEVVEQVKDQLSPGEVGKEEKKSEGPKLPLTPKTKGGETLH